jgi:hypothetical protein
MRITAITLFVLAFIIGGCESGYTSSRRRGDVSIPKTFFGRTISYTVDAGAKEYMSKLESLLTHSAEATAPMPDRLVLPLYRDADMDRNHRITASEAEVFYREYVLKFEDSLGRTVY